MDLVVKAMLDTGYSPGNYMSAALKDFLIPCPAERVDLATSNSAQSIPNTWQPKFDMWTPAV